MIRILLLFLVVIKLTETPLLAQFRLIYDNSIINLWDAYTEVNEYPGADNKQAPHKSAPNTGMDESGDVHIVTDGFTYPAIDQMIKVTFAPMSCIDINNILKLG